MSHLASADEAENRAECRPACGPAADIGRFPFLSLCFANSGGIFPRRRTITAPWHARVSRSTAARRSQGRRIRCSRSFGLRRPGHPDAHRAGRRTVGYVRPMSPRETRLATIASGYADGLPRQLSTRGAVLFQGVRLPIVGRVSMDSITVDVSALAAGHAEAGQPRRDDRPAPEPGAIAADARTISYEILTRLGHRYHREYR